MSIQTSKPVDFEAVHRAALITAIKRLPNGSERETAEDIAQSVVAIIQAKIKDEIAIENPEGYARIVSIGLCADYLRKLYKHRKYLDNPITARSIAYTEEPSSAAEATEQRIGLGYAILALDTLDRIHLVAYGLGVAAEDIQEEFYGDADIGHSLSTVYYHRQRALNRARDLLSA